MSDRFEEMGRFTEAMNNLLEVRQTIDESVLTEVDKAILIACDEYCATYGVYSFTMLCDLLSTGIKRELK